jgi:predicted metalloprotease
MIFSRFGIGGTILAVIVYVGFSYFSNRLDTGSPDAAAPTARGAQSSDERVQFVSFVLDDVQKSWAKAVPGYRHAKLVIFSNGTSTGCGYGQRAVGPFYCPEDETVYLDLDFFKTLQQRLGAGGDFARAYVIAHEIGHHIQKLSGLDAKLAGVSARARTGASGVSVKLELQADCYAGVWAHGTSERQLLEAGDLEEALTAAKSIGDDTLQRQTQGTVRPETFTHGTSAQRVEWFQRGLKSGRADACDTFAAGGGP